MKGIRHAVQTSGAEGLYQLLKDALDSLPYRDGIECPNCECIPSCIAKEYCDGCDLLLCIRCWEEHNEYAPCHDEG